MTPDLVIQTVLQEIPQTGWMVFRFHKLRALFMLLFKLFLVIIFGGGAAVLAWSGITQDPHVFIFSALLGIPAVIALVVFLKHLRSVQTSQTNMIVLTEDAIVKSWCGNLEEYPYNAVTHLMLSRSSGNGRFPEHSVAFVDRRTNKRIELAANWVFGPAQQVHEALQNKIL